MTEPSESALSSALRAMIARDIVEHPTRMIDLRMRANRLGAYPKLRLFETKFVNRFAKIGIPMFAHNMIRTAQEQEALFVRGVTKSRAGKSPHNFGLAVDLIHPLLLWDNMTPDMWKMVGHVGKEVAKQNGVSIVWGGDWSDPDGDGIGWDPAHWEIADWKNLKGKFPWPEPPKTTISSR